ncbi:MAG: TetR/AcrR family transcriptional regulator [candidate division Zixibacteria bacterium]|nr:TetR/AcrR family transcriptional regulator [candidate division Zixibacteria bacterium]
MNSQGGSRKDLILKQATQLFAEQGYDKTTVRHIATACDITEPALYRHFASKDDIFKSVLQQIPARARCDELFQRLQSETSLEAILSGLAKHILSFFTTNQDLYRLLLYSSLSGHKEAEKVYRVIRGNLASFLKDQLDRLAMQKLASPGRSEITARCFIGMVFDCSLSDTLWKGYQRQTFKPEEVVANNIPIYVKGLSVE